MENPSERETEDGEIVLEAQHIDNENESDGGTRQQTGLSNDPVVDVNLEDAQPKTNEELNNDNKSSNLCSYDRSALIRF